MFQLKELHIQNFKNIKSVHLDFDSKYVFFIGDNGMGKTNLLDAIHYLSLGRSYFNVIENQNVNHDETFFNLKGVFSKETKPDTIFIAYVRNHRKNIKKNGTVYEKFSAHLGQYPVVIVTPYDIDLIIGGNEERRRFIDIISAQVDRNYFEHLSKYNHSLKQRNAQLKMMNERNQAEHSLIAVYDELLDYHGHEIYNYRKEFFVYFHEHFNKFYKAVSGDMEKVEIVYKSQLSNGQLLKQLKDGFRKDLMLQRTNFGIHKDEIDFLINDYPLKKFGSQGQQKSFLMALKLSQFQVILDKKNIPPILLLDDIFDRLDENRVSNLLDIIAKGPFGQVFITDTSEGSIRDIFGRISITGQLFRIENGQLITN
jgi:DNA replication and repair protein RecF